MTELTQARLKEAVRYDKQTGMFFWRKDDKHLKKRKGERAGCENKVLGYWVIGLDHKTYYAHTLAWFYIYGIWPTYLEFINGNGLDARIKNLREKAGARLKEAKVCPICATTFNRHRSFSNAQWLAQVFCGKVCKEEHRRRAKSSTPRCRRCGGDGPFRCYKTSSGRTSRGGLCKPCFNAQRKPKRKAQHRRNAAARPAWYLFLRMKTNAKNRGKPTPMTYDEFVTEIGGECPTVCPVLGMPLEWSGNIHSEALATIDRIDSSKSYEPGNIAIISWKANALKRNGTADEHRRIADWLDSISSKKEA